MVASARVDTITNQEKPFTELCRIPVHLGRINGEVNNKRRTKGRPVGELSCGQSTLVPSCITRLRSINPWPFRMANKILNNLSVDSL